MFSIFSVRMEMNRYYNQNIIIETLAPGAVVGLVMHFSVAFKSLTFDTCV
jgi:hypothetical protein